MRRRLADSGVRASCKSLFLCWFWICRHHPAAFPSLFIPGMTANCSQVIIEFFCIFFTNFVDIFDDSVGSHFHTSNSSCGVQIIGGSYPKKRMMDSIFGLNAGFAICVQFQVNR